MPETPDGGWNLDDGELFRFEPGTKEGKEKYKKEREKRKREEAKKKR